MSYLLVALLLCSTMAMFCTADDGCPPNEIKWCSRICEPSCAVKDPFALGCRSEFVCTKIGIQNGPCRCKQGYVRDGQDRCISPDECPNSSSSE